MEPEQLSGRPALGSMLESLRKRKRFTRHALSVSSGVSTTYIVQIEGGIDGRTGKEVHPSPQVLGKLAEALADGDPVEADGFYEEMMAAAGYLRGAEPTARSATREDELPRFPRAHAPGTSTPADGSTAHEPRSSPLPLREPIPQYAAPVAVSLRDPRLHGPFRGVVDHWEELSEDEQSAVLTLMRLLDERLRRH